MLSKERDDGHRRNRVPVVTSAGNTYGSELRGAGMRVVSGRGRGDIGGGGGRVRDRGAHVDAAWKGAGKAGLGR